MELSTQAHEERVYHSGKKECWRVMKKVSLLSRLLSVDPSSLLGLPGEALSHQGMDPLCNPPLRDLSPPEEEQGK